MGRNQQGHKTCAVTLKAVSDEAARQRGTVVPLQQKDIRGALRYAEAQWYPPLIKGDSSPACCVVDIPIDLVRPHAGSPRVRDTHGCRKSVRT